MAHISHLTEDRSITFGTIRAIVSAAVEGRLPNATEKLDGVNIVFTCTPKYELRFARSDSDIKSGGMIAAVLEAKYTGRGLVQDTFVKGSNAIRTAMRALSPTEVKKAFDGGQLWYSAEIVYTKNPNVVHYAEDGVVLHARPVLRCAGGQVTVEPNAPFDLLERAVPDMDDLTKPSGWRVNGPQRLDLPPMETTYIVTDVYKQLDAMGGDDKTIQDHLSRHAKLTLKLRGVSDKWAEIAAKRLAEEPGCPSLTELKGQLGEGTVSLLRNSNDWVKRALEMLDHALTSFSTQLLSATRSKLVADHDAEVARINSDLMRCIGLVHTSRNTIAGDILQAQLARFGSNVKVTTPVEGVVFTWDDKVYKLTGAFAPANAIMGLVKYGRGKAVPPIGG